MSGVQCRFWAAFIGVAVLVVSVCSAPMSAQEIDESDVEFASQDVRFFEEFVRPILVEKCIDCHGETKQEGDLRLDNRENVLLGGQSGPAIDVGQADVSLLVEAIRYESFEMPPDEPLSDEEIDFLYQWIQQGAAWTTDAQLANLRMSEFTREDREHWAFQPVRQVAVPGSSTSTWVINEIDSFVLARLEQHQLTPAEQADKRTLIRRVTFALTGLPPTPEEIESFLNDSREDAYPRLVRELLNRPQFGERLAQHWLDLVRYADSDGYKADFKRPDAWLYRDYVVRSFNADKPYDRFVKEQLAGDELFPDDMDAQIATGYLRHWIYEFNQRDAISQWQIILDDVTETTADVFLGLGFSCARCHDHKYDPILQRDYFRFQAFFNSIYPRDDRYVSTSEAQLEYEENQQQWESATREIRQQMSQLETPLLERTEAAAVGKFNDRMQGIYRMPAEQRSTYEQQIAHLIELQVIYDQEQLDFSKKLDEQNRAQWTQLKAQLDAVDVPRPAKLQPLFGVTDWGTRPADTFIPGDVQQQVVEPGFPSLWHPESADILDVPAQQTTGRRATLAEWIASPRNPLTARVIVNRLWQQYFGLGLVETTNDFGRLGSLPSHPQLLDYLAQEFVNQGWSLKELSFQMLTSATYRQSSMRSEAETDHAKSVDPNNRLLWKMNRRRLDAGQIRDAMLAVSGELDLATDGGRPASFRTPRRTVYLEVRRNQRVPFLEVFDFPDRIKSTGTRNETITPNQALEIVNGPWALQRAEAFAKGHASISGDFEPRFAHHALVALGRTPSLEELSLARSFWNEQNRLAQQTMPPGEAEAAAWVDLCNVLLNLNEFLFVD